MTGNSRKKTNGSSAHTRQGVADYFAILGVGEDLVWRHAQQKEQQEEQQLNEQEQDEPSSSLPSSSEQDQELPQTKPTESTITQTQKPLIPEEDDAMFLERFYREIVTCDIVLEDDDEYDNHDAVETGTSLTNTSALSVAAAEGWTVVRKTRPAATKSNPSDSSVGGFQDKQRRPPLPSLWDKGKIWETNLDPVDGLTGELLKAQHQRNAEYKIELEKQPGRGMGGHDAATPLKDLKKRVQSTFQSKTQQLYFTAFSSSQSNYYDQHHQKRRRNFYLTYKRRSPDQPNVPAIANLALFYARIHKSTIVAPFSETNSDLFDRGSTFDANHSGSGTGTLATTSTKTRTHAVAAVASAVGRNGYRASAALLNVGRQAVSSRWNTENPQAAGENNGAATSMMVEQVQQTHWGGDHPQQQQHDERGPLVDVRSLLSLPDHHGQTFEEWVIPEAFSCLRFPRRKRVLRHPEQGGDDDHRNGYQRPIQTTTVLFPESNDNDSQNISTNNNQGVEAVDRTPDRIKRGLPSPSTISNKDKDEWKERFMPRLVDPSDKHLLARAAGEQGEDRGERFLIQQNEDVIISGGSASFDDQNYDDYHSNRDEYIYVPVLAVRRQRIGDEERFSEDPALIDVSVSVFDERGRAVLPSEEYQFMTEEEMIEDENDDGEQVGTKLLHKTKWIESRKCGSSNEQNSNTSKEQRRKLKQQNKKQKAIATLGAMCLIVRHNVPMGFCDAAFSTRVLDRFPYKNYKGLPLPEEELPMFCYPTGCRLHRAKYSDAPLPQYYGFVVKNERGDSIYVSCVSFMEPLTNKKKEQLSKLSEKRRRVSLPHKIYWARRHQRNLRRKRMEQNKGWIHNNSNGMGDEHSALLSVASPSDWITVNERDEYYEDEDNSVLTAFDQMTTYENKTICLVSRYPYWTAFRRFLSHLHSVSGCSSDLPLERYISHLLLSVPVPRPGGPSILIPLPTFNIPLVLSSPPRKDLPLIDLPFERLLACLDVPTIVTIVIGFLALERKVIVMSKRPSLVLDVCECVRALLFPFELVAPYVPRLTEPFMSCLEFPGAIFAGIHDDGTSDGLAAIVRQQMPEDSTIIDLDSGNVDCSGDRMSVLNNSWGIIPPGPRSVLVSEIETLCRDASIVPGQEPLDGILDPAFEASAPTSLVEDNIPLSNEDREPLDDRAIRDAFLRFFCSVLVGYERFLVVPDVDFLISGNEWFDAKGFLDAASEEKAVFLGSLVSTQLFQSFIQRRTEASDVHLLLFDECLQEYHSSSVPYGRLGGDVETIMNKETGKSQMLYSLLVDQAAEESRSVISVSHSFDGDSRGQGSDTDNSSGRHMSKSITSDATDRLMKFSEFGVNSSGDWVTKPSRKDIPNNVCFTYCVDGNPTFPDKLNQCFYVPRQPESWLVEMSTTSTPMLTRSRPEKEEAERRRRFSTSYRGLHSQRKCLWQLPKLMGSHFLGTWLLCIPTLVSQSNISHGRQSTYLLRAFGALRLLRSKQKIVPDEAAYRALIVACGRTKNDRRTELVKLFGHLRSDGIFPSAVTLGQYTRALAEGYSKRAVGTADDDTGGVEMTESTCVDLLSGHVRKNLEATLNVLDRSLVTLEESGRRWRQKTNSDKINDTIVENPSSLDLKPNDRQKKQNNNRSWLPVLLSSSFVETYAEESTRKDASTNVNEIQLTAIWSRTVACKECGYIPFEEEIQGGWDSIQGGERDFPGAVCCPRCGFLLTPKLAYKNMSLDEAIRSPQETEGLPPQIRPNIDENDDSVSLVTYVCPASLRDSLEQVVDEHGEEILDREKLREKYPDIFYNLWWFCARFQLPLPLPVSKDENVNSRHRCAIVSW
jgi:rubredoxin